MSTIITLYNAVTGTSALHISYYNDCEAGRYMDLNVYEGSSKTAYNRFVSGRRDMKWQVSGI
jgi:hypothetical protein